MNQFKWFDLLLDYLVGGTLGGAVLSLLLAALELIIYSVYSARSAIQLF